ncbi:MAG: bifunctional aldolase/short-chain dehydrogenase [Proteobacteria bacterium]|nr:bifunctional aldolase/short-chain dehydrogenase [Pseudomonadota bacterium]
MKSLWNEEEALLYTDPVSMRAYTSRLLGQSEDLVLHGGGNTSVKHTKKDIFGEPVETLFVKGSGHDLRTIRENGFSPTRLELLKRLAALDSLSDIDMMRELKSAQLDPAAPAPSVEALLHAIIPFKYVDHTHADSVVAISNTPNGPELIRSIYGERALILDYEMPGFLLSKQVHQATKDLNWEHCEAIILLHHGVFTFDDDAKRSYEKMIAIVSEAEDFLKAQKAWDAPVAKNGNCEVDAVELAGLRKAVMDKKGGPLVARFSSDRFVELPDLELATRGPITPDHVLHTKRIAMVCTGDHKADVEAYAQEYEAYFERNKEDDLVCLDKAPRWAVWKGKGRFVFAPNGKRLRVISDIIDHTTKAIQWGEVLGGWRALSEKEIFDLEYWELEQAKLKRKKAAGELEGTVALVTGAASGIGRATVNELLSAGACVVGVDLCDSVKDLATTPSYVGLVCDVRDSEAIKETLKSAVLHFGGVDILVSNAGIFPPSQKIEDLSDADWDLSMQVNLNAHFYLLRSAIPYLKHGHNPSVVFIGSKNVRAPGPGVSSYSVAKAGLNQLARVATMELAPYGIRVNSLHPDAVFDTGIWTDEVLEGRAAKYSMTVEDYKRRNLLKKPVSSDEVATAVRIFAGGSLSSSTGAHLSIDGGNERTV